MLAFACLASLFVALIVQALIESWRNAKAAEDIRRRIDKLNRELRDG